MGRMKKTSKEYCMECVYGCGHDGGQLLVCDYFLMTGKRRGCEVGVCDKFKKGKKRREKCHIYIPPRRDENCLY